MVSEGAADGLNSKRGYVCADEDSDVGTRADAAESGVVGFEGAEDDVGCCGEEGRGDDEGSYLHEEGVLVRKG